MTVAQERARLRMPMFESPMHPLRQRRPVIYSSPRKRWLLATTLRSKICVFLRSSRICRHWWCRERRLANKRCSGQRPGDVQADRMRVAGGGDSPACIQHHTGNGLLALALKTQPGNATVIESTQGVGGLLRPGS